MSTPGDGLHPAVPPRPRSALRRHSRWLIPVLALALTPLPVAVGVGLTCAVAWAGLKVFRAVRGSRPALAPRGQIALGHDPRGRAVSLDDHQLGAHGLILGASGSGKSTTLLGIVAQQVLQGRPVIAIDLKGSTEFAGQLRAAALAAGRPFRVWTPDGAEHWNPLAHGNPTELKDKLVSTERFSEPHYQRAAERYLQTALQVHAELHPGRPPGLAEVVTLLDPNRLKATARGLSVPRRAHVEDYVRTLSPDQLSAVRGLQSRLAIVSESHTGTFLESAAGGADRGIDLRRALEGPEVVLFSLNASTYGRLSAQLGALAVQDLVSAAGARERAERTPIPATVAIDEFSALGEDHVMALIARGRSAGISVLLATQELADLDRVSPGFRQQLIGSTAVKIAHRQDGPESAREVSRLAGSEPVWEASYSRGEGIGLGARGRAGRVTHRLAERPRVDPGTVQSLRTGEAVVITKLPESETRLTRIQPLGLLGPERSRASERGRPDGGRGGPGR